VTLPPFDLHRAETTEEARELLLAHGDDAAVLCGGTELLLLLKLGFAAYGHLVDIRGIEELRGVATENGELILGATATHREIERSPLVAQQLPALAAMERRVANLRVRNAGTLGGNLCFSDPHSDPATFLLAVDAEAEWDGGRTPLSHFLVGPYETRLAPGELLRRIRIPAQTPGLRLVHRKLAFHERPAATVTCGVVVHEGTVVEARLAVGSVGTRAVRATAAEQHLTGAPAGDETVLSEAAEQAAEAAGAVEDANGSAAYKEQLVRVLVQRCFREALSNG
jgi:carbon-monoxide dehydrogenase medium subunit